MGLEVFAEGELFWEAALNILIHRTWWSSGNVLSVAIFDDRVEFANPGAFPPGTSPESFYRRPQSQPINKLISEVFFKSGLMEAWGQGIPDIFDLCKESVLPGWSFRLKYLYLHDSNPPVYENSHRTSPRLPYRMQHNGASGWVFE